jgi:exopolysaccharide biosynthesis WecB/TagA/CpsF family protein
MGSSEVQFEYPVFRGVAERDDHAVLAPEARPALTVLHTDVDVISGDDVLAHLRETGHRCVRHVAYVNAHSLNLAWAIPAYQEALSRCDLVLNDGIGFSLAARMRGVRVQENLNGSDFTLRILELAAARRWRVFLFGGQPGVADETAARLQERIEGLEIVGACTGHDVDAHEVTAMIRAAAADVVLVALGQPKQELWLDEHLAETGCYLGVGVGAFFDFVSGRVTRAPAWMNKTGIEWLFRLFHEPRRLWRRYVLGNPVFLWRAWRLRKMERRHDRRMLATTPGEAR